MTSLRPNMYSRFLCRSYESLSGMFRRHFSFQHGQTGDTSEKVSGPAFDRPTVQQAFSGLSRAPHDPVMAGSVHFEFDAFAPALVVHGVAPRGVAA